MSGSVTPLSTLDRRPDEDDAPKDDASGEAGLPPVEEPAVGAAQEHQVILGDSGNNHIEFTGSAMVNGLDGDDTIVNMGDEPSTILGGLGNDTLIGGGGNDQIGDDEGENYGRSFYDGRGGDDTIIVNNGDATILGGDGDDLIFGAGQIDVDGGPGDDTIVNWYALGSVQGGDGYDSLYLLGEEGSYERSDAPEGSGFDYGLTQYGDTMLVGGIEKVVFTTSHATIGALFPYGAVPCYVRGTRILTPSGEVLVEALRVGDAVQTARGEAREIRWIGQRRVALARHPQPHRARPVRILAGALADGVPRRDLLVSPAHAMMLDGLLFRAGHLLNGATIRQEAWPEVEYFHLELDSHDILLAEGAPAESYLDDDNRSLFGGAVTALHPDFGARKASGACLPFAAGLAQTQPVLARLQARAEAMGWRLDDAPGLHMLADGQRLPPLAANARLYHFALPAGLRSLRLCSADFRPCVTEPGSEDDRVLGVALRRILLTAPGREREVPLSHPALATGFHPVECDRGGHWRWTDGNADLTALLPLLPAGGARLTLHLRGASRAWLEPGRQRHAGRLS